MELHIPYHIVKYADMQVHGALMASIALQLMSRPEMPVIYVNAVSMQVALWGDVCNGRRSNDKRRAFLRDGLDWLEREGLIIVQKVISNGVWLIDCSRLLMYDESLEAHCETWSPEREARYTRIIDADPAKYGDFGSTPATGPYWRTPSGFLVIHRFVTMTLDEFHLIVGKCTMVECERVLRYFLYLMSTTYAGPESKRGVGHLSLNEQSFEYGNTVNALRKYRDKLVDFGLLWVYHSEVFEEKIKSAAAPSIDKIGHGGHGKKTVATLERELIVCPEYAYGRARDQKRISAVGRFIERPGYALEVGEGYHPLKRDTQRVVTSAYQKHFHWLQGTNYKNDELREIYFTLFLDNASRTPEKKRDLTDYTHYEFYLGETPSVELLRKVRIDPSSNIVDAVKMLTNWWYEETEAGQKAQKREAYFEWEDMKKKARAKKIIPRY